MLASVIAAEQSQPADQAALRYSGSDQVIEARIVAVADVFDALISKRPYKRAWSIDEALQYISDESGKLFDPACVAALLRGRERVDEICRRFANPAQGPGGD